MKSVNIIVHTHCTYKFFFYRARRLSRTDSQIFEDSVELMSYYIDQRDYLCRGTLQSPALAFTRETMATSVELVKQCKILQEHEDEDETRYCMTCMLGSDL